MEVPVKLVDHHLHVHVHLVIQEQIVEPVTIHFYNLEFVNVRKLSYDLLKDDDHSDLLKKYRKKS